MEFSSYLMCYNTSSFQRCELLLKQIWEQRSPSPSVRRHSCTFILECSLWRHLSQNLKDWSGQTHPVLEPVSFFKFSLLASTQAAIICTCLTFPVTPPHFCRGVNNSAGVTHKKRFLLALRCGNCGLQKRSDYVTVCFCWSLLMYRALISNLNSARGSLSHTRSPLTS